MIYLPMNFKIEEKWYNTIKYEEILPCGQNPR